MALLVHLVPCRGFRERVILVVHGGVEEGESENATPFVTPGYATGSLKISGATGTSPSGTVPPALGLPHDPTAHMYYQPSDFQTLPQAAKYMD